jgi:hypothetical protein
MLEMKVQQSSDSIGTTQVKRIKDSYPSSLKSSKVTDYSWTGNHWIPPPGVPTFTPSQMRGYFSQKNVLFIGDSIGRRSYATMFGMMNATDWRDVDVNEIDSSRIIDVNKGRRIGEELCSNKERQIFNSTFYEKLCRDLPALNTTGTPAYDGHGDESARETGGDSPLLSHSDSSKKGKFDYIRMNCYGEIHDYFSGVGAQERMSRPNSTSIVEDYDLIVISMGIHDIIRGRKCSKMNNSTIRDPLERLNMTLSVLQAVSSPKLQIVFRTVGFSQGSSASSWKMIKGTNDIFERMDNQTSQEEHTDLATSNMTMVDWGTVISRRSENEKRISGDIKPHYGLEARPLFAQQLMHSLILADEQIPSSIHKIEEMAGD